MNNLINTKSYLALLLSAGLLLTALTGCETTEGVGKDIQKAGEAVEEAAEEAAD